MAYFGSILAFSVVPPAHGSETELKIAPLLSLSLSLDCIDRVSISIRPPTAIGHRLSPLYPASGPPSLLSLLSIPPCLSSPSLLSVSPMC